MRTILILLTILFFGCNSETGWDCIKTTGEIVSEERSVPEFTEILVWDGISVYIEQGPFHKVIIESGKNLLDGITATVENNKLEIRDSNSCNLFRDYDITTVYITVPNLTEIRSSSGFPVRSTGVLEFPELRLVSEDYQNKDTYHSDGEFFLNLDVGKLSIVANNLSVFHLRGKAVRAHFGLYSGDCRIYADDLKIDYLDIFHRSTGPMIVNPQESIRGKIVSLGDVIAKNRPPVVEVEELYRGRLIFE